LPSALFCSFHFFVIFAFSVFPALFWALFSTSLHFLPFPRNLLRITTNTEADNGGSNREFFGKFEPTRRVLVLAVAGRGIPRVSLSGNRNLRTALELVPI
jgi:hypothetical protein